MANIQDIVSVIEAATKLIEAIKGLGIDMSGVKLHTSNPIDIGGLLGSVLHKGS